MVKKGTYSENFDAIFRRPASKPAPKFSDKAVRTTSLNPYFRDKFQFKNKQVYLSREYALAKSRERSRLLNLQIRALSKLKPKKADRGKLAFYRVKIERKGGKAVPVVTRIRGKALLRTPVYVLKGGKKRFSILNPYDSKTLGKGVTPRPSAQRLDSLDVRRIRRRRIDYQQYIEKTEKLYRKKFISKPVTPKVLKILKTRAVLEPSGTTVYTVLTPGGNLDRFYKSVLTIWIDLVRGQRKQMSWKILGKAYLSTGKIIDFEPQALSTNRFFELGAKGLGRAVGETKSAKRVYSTPFLFDLYSKYLHSGLSGALASEGLFSQSSIRRIKSRPYNFGKPQSQWETRSSDGARLNWPGNPKVSWKPAEIQKISFIFKQSATP